MNPQAGNNPFADLNANFNQSRLATLGQPQQSAPKVAAPVQHGNFWTHLLPTLGGTVGGIGGGALLGTEIGTGLLPGIGTAAGGLIGALLGGAAGGATGKVVENNQEHQALGNGVAGQAIENGLLSAGPLRLLKGAGAAGKALLGAGEDAAAQTTGNAAVQGTSKLADAINAGGTAASQPGMVGKVLNNIGNGGSSRVAGGMGIGIGDKIGSNQLTPDASSALQNFIANRAKLYGGLAPGTPEGQAVQAQALHNNVISALGDRLGQINRTVTPEETAGIAHVMQTTAQNNPALANANLSPLSMLAQQVTGATDLKGLEAARMAADKLAYQNGTDLGSSQLSQQAGHARDAIDQFITAQDPTYKAIKGDYQASKNLLDATTGSAQSATGVKVPLLPNTTLPAQASQGIVNKANGALAHVGAPNPFGGVGIASRTVPLGLAQAISQSNMANTNPTTTNSANTPNMSSNNMDASSQNNGNLSSGSASQSPYSQDALAYDIARDPANAAKYLSTYSSLDKIFNPAGDSLSTNQKNEVVSQQRALSSLNSYAQMLNAAGGAEGPLKGALDSSVLGGFTNPAAQAMDKQRMDIASAIAGSLNPRGTVSPTVARTIAESLPTIHDTPGAYATKMQSLIAQIKSGAYSGETPVNQIISANTAANGAASTPADLATALSSMGYGQ